MNRLKRSEQKTGIVGVQTFLYYITDFIIAQKGNNTNYIIIAQNKSHILL
jgi:hypothetical protein